MFYLKWSFGKDSIQFHLFLYLECISSHSIIFHLLFHGPYVNYLVHFYLFINMSSLIFCHTSSFVRYICDFVIKSNSSTFLCLGKNEVVAFLPFTSLNSLLFQLILQCQNYHAYLLLLSLVVKLLYLTYTHLNHLCPHLGIH